MELDLASWLDGACRRATDDLRSCQPEIKAVPAERANGGFRLVADCRRTLAQFIVWANGCVDYEFLDVPSEQYDFQHTQVGSREELDGALSLFLASVLTNEKRG